MNSRENRSSVNTKANMQTTKSIKISFLALFIQFVSTTLYAQTYKASYSLTYVKDSTNIMNKKSEQIILVIDESKNSYSYSENFAKSDSIKKLVKEGKISAFEVMGDTKNLFRTNFNQFTKKDYTNQQVVVYEKIGVTAYMYYQNTPLEWQISAEQDTILGYSCTKASTKYAGRDYEAWFTTEIPFSDGPYIFSGLPGLILKLSDRKNHYCYTITSFQKNKGNYLSEPVFKEECIVSKREKVLSIREEYRTDFEGFMERQFGMKNITQLTPEQKRNLQSDNNPIELK